MKAYKITSVNSNKNQYFRKLSTLCEEYDFSYNYIINKKSKKGMPIFKKPYTIELIEIK